MCGIVGAVAQRNVVPILLEGLRRLEYRGYDSAGLVTINGGLKRVRSVGRVAALADDCVAQQIHGHLGIAHTRWATHGAPSEANAHPHVSGSLAVVHNGIIENHEALRTRLKAAGFVFTSETDTEVIAHLVNLYYRQSKDLLAAVRTAVAELEGAYAIGVVSEDAPHRLICARRGSPLLIGLGIEENFIASDVSALLPVTQRVMYLDEGDVADIGLLAVTVYDAAGNRADRSVHISELSADMAELGNYRHFMQKEIHEQPRALTDTLLTAVAQDHIQPEWFGFDAAEVLAKVNAVTFLACGTSYHAAKVATYCISQSGETADTLAALNHARELGQDKTLTICNVPESALTRASRLKFLTRAGPEIGVASTKAFTTQLAALFLLTLVLAKLRGRLTAAQEAAHLTALRSLPNKVQQVLALEPQVEAWSQRFANKHHALFLGRGVHYPIALEGALKLKEISYIHAEGYPAGELKHGPLALVDEDMPVITIAPNDQLIEKLKSNLQEVRARGGELYVFADGDVHLEESAFVHVIKLPGGSNGALSPILHTVTLQMLSYHAALQKGTDVDKPRNLAKSVTVE
ncbi:MAG: glutamine--fructose-6-phosphate aminotransferase [Thiobacillus sp. SCN 62-729]|nr:MAG: glutamine--fructose-6-phosphate aminotransferase [Thiobacillus sp. SCN 62-729]